VKSTRYPFCAAGPADADSSVRSGMTLVPFNETLNRLILKVPDAEPGVTYKVTWGDSNKMYQGTELKGGVNLAADFQVNPFTPAFTKVDAAIAAKEAFETESIKKHFHSEEAKTDLESIATRDEEQHMKLAAAVKDAFQPVTHTISIVAQP
jgi:hypothetical protein